MFTIEKASSKDFEKVYPCLQRFEDLGAGNSKEEWKRIFIDYWETPEDFCGYMLLKNGQVKGYLGLIFSNRIFNNKPEKFCNLTTWIVDEDSRNQSLPLLLQALKLKDYTFTCFTADSRTTAVILSRLGFMDFEVHQRVLLPIPDFRMKKQGSYICEFNLQRIRSYLNENDRVIFDNHQMFDCEHLVLKSGEKYSYIILKRVRRRNMPFAKVHYVSNVGYFAESIENFIIKICIRFRVFGVMIDERYLGNYRLRKSFRHEIRQKAYFKSNSDTLDKNQIDTLYSESVILPNC